MQNRSLAVIGTQGVPSQYGGFETLVEFLVKYLAIRFDITVFCSSKVYTKRIKDYKGVKLEYISLSANGLESIPFDILSILKARKRFDKILILGASGGIVLPLMQNYKDKFILNFGGLDWKRSKWNVLAQKFLKLSECLAIKYSGSIISDNIGIQNYIKAEYGKDSTMIAYGGDQVEFVKPIKENYHKYSFLNKPYAFSVARIQPDNNIDMILEAFEQYQGDFPIIFVGNWNSCEYGDRTKSKFSGKDNIILFDAIYDQKELNLLRSNCTVYVHGHSAGGTNPSLVEAMHLGLPVFSYASGFNEYTTHHKAKYFKSSTELSDLVLKINISELHIIGANLKSIAEDYYTWNLIAEQYAEIIEN